MRIVIDLQGAQTESRFRGIGRYSLSLTKALVRNRGDHEVLIALSGLSPDTIEPIRAAFDGLLPQENIRVWYAPGPVLECQPGNTWRREAAERIREAFLASLQPDVVFVTSLFEGFVDDAVTSIGVFDQRTPTAVLLYDLIPLLNPDQYLGPNPAYEQHYMRKLEHLKRAHAWLAISESSAKEGVKALDLREDRVFNISTACDERFKRIDISPEEKAKPLQKYGISRSFLLYTGAADMRKNLQRLIRAYASISPDLRRSHQLVLAGKFAESDLQSTAKSAGLSKDELILTGYISDGDLVQLYNLCKLFVFPSCHEGFGLPALEAMACGAPVIASNTSSMPEVVGRKDALFDPYSEEAIASRIVEALTNEDLREDLIRHGLLQSNRFSWDESARRAIAALENLDQDLKKRPLDSVYPGLIESIAGIRSDNPSKRDLIASAWAISINHPEESSKKLFVDVSELAQRDGRTGIQRVTRSILKELLNNPPSGYQVEPIYATTDRPGYRHARRFMQCFIGCLDGRPEEEPIDAKQGDIFLGLDLHQAVTIAQVSYLESLRDRGVRIFFVVYDLLPVLMPERFPHGIGELHEKWLNSLYHISEGAISISKSTADEVAEWLKTNTHKRLRPLKIGWFHIGADIENSVPTYGLPDDAPKVLAQLAARPSFLMVGTIEPRKGHFQTLAAFEQLWAEWLDANLVIVGKQGWNVEKLAELLCNHPEHGSRLFWLEGISDEYLKKVYAASTCLIAASEGEGFGLPLIEAVQHKLSIIARDIPVFHEVAGKYAFYFNGKEPADLAKAVREWQKLYQSGMHPKSDNMPWLTWKQSTKQLLDVILGQKWILSG